MLLTNCIDICTLPYPPDLAISCKEGCTMNCGKYVPWCLKDSMHYNCTQILAQEPPLQQESPASAGQPLSQMPQANTGISDAGFCTLDMFLMKPLINYCNLLNEYTMCFSSDNIYDFKTK